MKKMSFRSFEKRGLRKGDIFKVENLNGNNRWGLVLTDELIVYLGKPVRWGNVSDARSYYDKITFLIQNDDIDNMKSKYEMAEFFIYPESHRQNVEEICTEIVATEYVKCVHFGNPKEYTWEVPVDLMGRIKVGNIVVVDTRKGPQLVEVEEVLTDYDGFILDKRELKQVISIART